MTHRLVSIAAVTVVLLSPTGAPGVHCDGMDGPVVMAAQKALDRGNVNLILIWVQKKDEAEIRKAFEATLAVRNGGPHAKDLADRFFFETVVRVHRAGEGAPFTGLNPGGRDLGPALPAADKAIADGVAGPLVKLLCDAVEHGLQERFKEVLERKGYKPDNVDAGRKFVKAYVEFIHYVERLYEDAKNPAHGHFTEGEDHR